MCYTIYFDLLINTTKSALYDAVSLPEELVKWWPKNCKGKRAEGEVYNYFFGEPYDWYAKVESLTPNKYIAFKITEADDDWNLTTFSYEIIEQPNQLKLRFQHANWPENNDHFRFSAFCWAQLLNGLKKYLEKGEEIPFRERS
ncbi:hypothetical protein GCM10027429_26780 [Marivirga atlantica]|jgi:uncharacterized protein YndB with AHSA1/START domain|uniref:SRPBCC domain-containing protein n=1 Tax=Marivirga atlantica TaxID=1548457 RepID=A0A937DJS3_9BACT|nr:SRPBCC domain-containing protein [Marivirga atlantica]MBL0766280.1 SRPBCC domain-containing protein [Marivirga atlantica]